MVQADISFFAAAAGTLTLPLSLVTTAASFVAYRFCKETSVLKGVTFHLATGLPTAAAIAFSGSAIEMGLVKLLPLSSFLRSSLVGLAHYVGPDRAFEAVPVTVGLFAGLVTFGTIGKKLSSNLGPSSPQPPPSSSSNEYKGFLDL